MDKMVSPENSLFNSQIQIQDTKGKVLITNDGATILKQMEVIHPTAKMVSLSHKKIQKRVESAILR